MGTGTLPGNRSHSQPPSGQGMAHTRPSSSSCSLLTQNTRRVTVTYDGKEGRGRREPCGGQRGPCIFPGPVLSLIPLEPVGRWLLISFPPTSVCRGPTGLNCSQLPAEAPRAGHRTGGPWGRGGTQDGGLQHGLGRARWERDAGGPRAPTATAAWQRPEQGRQTQVRGWLGAGLSWPQTESPVVSDCPWRPPCAVVTGGEAFGAVIVWFLVRTYLGLHARFLAHCSQTWECLSRRSIPVSDRP